IEQAVNVETQLAGLGVAHGGHVMPFGVGDIGLSGATCRATAVERLEVEGNHAALAADFHLVMGSAGDDLLCLALLEHLHPRFDREALIAAKSKVALAIHCEFAVGAVEL